MSNTNCVPHPSHSIFKTESTLSCNWTNGRRTSWFTLFSRRLHKPFGKRWLRVEILLFISAPARFCKVQVRTIVLFYTRSSFRRSTFCYRISSSWPPRQIPDRPEVCINWLDLFPPDVHQRRTESDSFPEIRICTIVCQERRTQASVYFAITRIFDLQARP